MGGFWKEKRNGILTCETLRDLQSMDHRGVDVESSNGLD